VQMAYSDARELRRSRGRSFKELCIHLFTKRSYENLRELFEQYKKTFQVDVDKSLVTNLTGSFRKGILSMVQFIKDPMRYWSTVLNNAIEGGHEQDEVLIRCILSRCEVDLLDIKAKFQEMYSCSLDESISKAITGNWMKVIRLLIRKPRPMKDSITSPNELLDASFESRRIFFHKKVESMGEGEANRVDWTRLSVTDQDATDNKEERCSRFFAGTLRRNSISISKDSCSHFGSYASSFNSSFTSLPNTVGNQSNSRSSLTSSNALGGNRRKKLEVRNEVFRRTSISSNDLEVERTSVTNSKAINSLRNQSILCRKVDVRIKVPRSIS